MIKNISKNITKRLCTGCGACSILCNKIHLEEKNGYNIPIADKNCTNCGQCLSVCPVHNNQFKNFNSNFLKALSCNKQKVCYSLISNIRSRSASGGFITQFLCDLLELNIINGCIVAYSDGKLENQRAIVAKTTDEIISACSSKYYPIPMLTALKDIDTNKKYAFVGKGCDISGLVLLQKKLKYLQNAIILKIGLMCYKSPSKTSSLTLYKEMTGYQYNFGSSKLYYRYNGWPGDAIAIYDNISNSMPYSKSWGKILALKSYSKHCTICTNHLCENADIVVGDAWYRNKELVNSPKEAANIIIPYSNYADELLNKSINIKFEKCTPADIINSQKNLIQIQELALLYEYFRKIFQNNIYFFLNLNLKTSLYFLEMLT